MNIIHILISVFVFGTLMLFVYAYHADPEIISTIDLIILLADAFILGYLTYEWFESLVIKIKCKFRKDEN